ncbi:LETM1-related biofilm-associated protein [Flavobacterium sp.]|uniref:LETM1-related biofilm-associated protein n=1 Tax=Flavobacterium sp. TaxID=239 RepID=UPI00375348C8
MINPSANGWIDKYFSENVTSFSSESTLSFYKKIRESGFIFGHIITLNASKTIDITNWKSDETSKVALLNSLFLTYCNETKDSNSTVFIEKAVVFYNEMHPKGFSLFKNLLSNTNSQKLESLINQRVQTNKDSISKNFSHIVTNALLFLDILAFKMYLEKGEISEKYLQKIEEIILTIISLALQLKTKKTQNDDLLIKLFEASVRYTKFSDLNKSVSLENLSFNFFTNDLERFYLLDLAGMALWNDGIIENDEIYFLHKLGDKLNLTSNFVEESIANTNIFIGENKKNIQYFNYSNPVKHFYDQTTNGVEVLINRNKKRLVKELSESKELLTLLAKSTKNDLSKEEKKKVKKQLLDVCKSIPSLTIFLLPGGALLLPILIKFIPQLLPSAFNENLEED